MNLFWSLTDKRDSSTMTADRFSIALMISFSDLVEVAHTETQAEVSFGALIATGAFVAFVDFVIWVFPIYSVSRMAGAIW